jgi:hypothetical protein
MTILITEDDVSMVVVNGKRWVVTAALVGPRSNVGPLMACSILLATGRFLLCANLR